MFFAIHRDEILYAEYDLRQLLALVADLHDPRIAEDVAVWHVGRLVVVVQADGSHVWLQPQHKPAEPAAAAA
jgi:hypothetical protein